MIEKIIYPETARKILTARVVTNFLGIDLVIDALSKKGFDIKLTQEEKQIYEEIPFSKATLESVANKEWLGKRAIIWAAPPKRYAINMLKLRAIFGTDKSNQPCFDSYESYDSLCGEKFSKEILRPGYHLTSVELPDRTRRISYRERDSLIIKKSQVVKPVELAFLAPINFLINNGDRVLKEDWSRTDAVSYHDFIIGLGFFDSYGLDIKYWLYNEGNSEPALVSCYPERRKVD